MKLGYCIAVIIILAVLLFPAEAGADQNDGGGTSYRFLYELIFLAGAGIGTAVSWKISKAFKSGKLAMPWMLITGASIVFAVGSILSMMVHFDLIHGNESLGAIVCLGGMTMLLAAGYLYMRVILR